MRVQETVDRVLWYDLLGRWHLPRSEEGGGSPEPKNVSEVRSFLGMAQYSARFIPDFATVTERLRVLAKKETEWVWGKTQMSAFQEVKDRLAECATTAYFEVGKDRKVLVYASPVGLAALLVQEGRVVSYASRSLSDVETRYSQTEREALAVVWGCEHFHRFINGAPKVTVITDHKPLENIWKKPKPPLRIERWVFVCSHTRCRSCTALDREIQQTTCHDIPQGHVLRVVVSNRWLTITFTWLLELQPLLP